VTKPTKSVENRSCPSRAKMLPVSPGAAARIVILAALSLLPWLTAASAALPEVRFEPDGRAVLENALVELKVSNRPGGWSEGIQTWFFKPIGHEMVDVLYGQTDTVRGHLLGEVWDPVTIGNVAGGAPKYGKLYVPDGYGADRQRRAAVLRQVASDGCELCREIILRRDLAVAEIRFRLTNVKAEPAGMSLRLHSAMSPGARGRYQRKDDTLFLRTEKGILELDQALNLGQYNQAYGDDKVFNRFRAEEPARGWCNPAGLKTPLLEDDWAVWANRAHGDGMLVIINAESLLGYYNCPGVTLEPVLRCFSLKPGESWQARVYLGAFSGLKGKKAVGTTPVYVETEALTLAEGRLRGEILPLWQGRVEVLAADGRAVQRASAGPTEPLKVEAQVGEGWKIRALDTEGLLLGEVDAGRKASLYEPQVDFPPVAKPRVSGPLYEDKAQRDAIRSFLAGRDFTVYCAFKARDEEKAAAREIARRLGAGLSWIEPGGEMLVVGHPGNNNLVRDAGLLKGSVDAKWPGAGRGAVLHYDNYEGSRRPLLMLCGSDAAGAAQAAQAFLKDYLAGVQPPTGFEFWETGTDAKIYPYTRPAGNRRDGAIRLQAAKGEYEPAQVVITAYDDLDDVQVEVAPLVSAADGKEIRRHYLTPYRRWHGPLLLKWVNYFPVARSAYRNSGHTGHPDPLLMRPEPRIAAMNSQALWLTALVPEGAAAGLYRSSITCRAGGKEKSIPIELEVWDFTLPKDGLGGEPYMNLVNMSPDGTRMLGKAHIEALVRDFVEHGIRVIHLGGPQGTFRWHFSPEGSFKGTKLDWVTVSDDGCVALDASEFDRLVKIIDQAAQPFSLGYMIYGHTALDDGTGGRHAFAQAMPKRFADRPPRKGHWLNDYYTQEMLSVLRRHLENRGWLDRMVVKIGDEPPGFNWWWENLAAAAREARLPISTAFNSIDWVEAEKGLGVVKEWKPLYMHYNKAFFDKARAAGDRIAWYNCGPPPRIALGASASEIRSYLWQAAKADLDIVAWWGIQCWGYEDSSHFGIWHDYYAHHNTVVYPEHPEKPATLQKGRGWVDKAPIDSIRWELIREGMEDAWYVSQLRRDIAAARKQGLGDAADKAQAVLDGIWKDVFPTLNDYNPGYRLILQSREKIARAILALRAAVREKAP